jgi:hypothetical protein
VNLYLRIVALLVAGAGGLFQAEPLAAPRPADESLARHVPADVGLFVEAHEAGDLLIPLIEPQVWTTLAELVGQPANPADAEVWRRQIRETVKMEPDHAIRVLFSERVAFVGEGLGRAQDAVVLCRPMPDIRISDLLSIFQAQPEPGPEMPKLYRLRAGMGLAASDRLLVFGDLRSPEGMFRRMVRFLGEPGARSLAEDAAYQALLRRVPAAPDGILFARLRPASAEPEGTAPAPNEPAAETLPATSPAATAPARPQVPEGGTARRMGSGLPGRLRGASTILVAMHRKDALLHFTAVGDVALPGRAPIGSGRLLVESLPVRTLVALEQRVDYPALVAEVLRLPERHALRLALQVQQTSGVLEGLLKELEQQTCLAVGFVTPSASVKEAPPAPAFAWIVRVHDARRAAEEFRVAVEACIAAYAVVSVSRGLPPLAPVASLPGDPVPVWLLDLGPLLPPPVAAALGGLHVCWAVDEEVLIVATHRDWLSQILEARRGAAERLAPALELSQRSVGTDSETVFVAQIGPIADLGSLWLAYFERHAPQMLQEAWWRGRQPGGGARLGIQVVEDPGNHLLEVVAVEPGSPSEGLLEVRDRLLGCNNRRFATSQPVEEMRTALAQRPHARWVDLLIERDGVQLVRRIPLPFVDPVQSLQRLIAIGRIVQRVVYHDDASQAAEPRGFMTVQLRTGDAPLFPLPPPATAPASQPQNTAGDE